MRKFFLQVAKSNNNSSLRIPTVIRWKRENLISLLQPLQWICGAVLLIYIQLFLLLVCLFFVFFFADWQGRQRRNEVILMVHLFRKLLLPIWKSGTKEAWRAKQSVETKKGRSKLQKTFTWAKLVPSKVTNATFYSAMRLFWGRVLRERLSDATVQMSCTTFVSLIGTELKGGGRFSPFLLSVWISKHRISKIK